MRSLTLWPLAIGLICGSAEAKEKPTRFWNLTGDTVTSLKLAPAGTDRFGENQCANDSDGTVDYDERLKIPGLRSGRYDVKLETRHGLACTVRDVDVVEGDVFSIEEKQLAGCRK
ncbi:hypothetical protein [Methylobacterium brachythecii]|uniref:Uncharacterized protein n=1 Tax=Methylobacterium brachythecii TaxID=1176177 RepID=A0A7W6F8U1_9HYPH|nr:hypothetical protein [Methylobacterium brachythecii]MBB3904804.1 hypothetical protein [Methylobacterium brachythecii]GLS45357.1 hypothetical protein GCM10007884_33470 [Methylobacterium brachythecii]